ncbi:MAG: hypothetical protein QOI03_2306 [Solirubrobacteraceae bacterium]|jgi:hypothetical protein|nr:hypothetical protein [Solirubrobacteraceae bacterium]
MEDVPEGITLERNRDLVGRLRHVLYRRALLCLIAVLPVLALLNVFGQRPTTSTAVAPAASLRVTAPARLRSGLIFQVRVEVTAHRDIGEPAVVFDRGWWESMSVNSIVPEPTQESSRNGQVVLTYGKLAAGRTLIAWIYFQVNPTNVGKRREDVEIDDGTVPLARLHRSLTIFP